MCLVRRITKGRARTALSQMPAKITLLKITAFPSPLLVATYYFTYCVPWRCTLTVLILYVLFVTRPVLQRINCLHCEQELTRRFKRKCDNKFAALKKHNMINIALLTYLFPEVKISPGTPGASQAHPPLPCTGNTVPQA